MKDAIDVAAQEGAKKFGVNETALNIVLGETVARLKKSGKPVTEAAIGAAFGQACSSLTQFVEEVLMGRTDRAKWFRDMMAAESEKLLKRKTA